MDSEGERERPAGDFGVWIEQMQGALRGEHGSDVPCDGCTACCTSSQFVHIEPDEVDALAHIPRELQFPAPRSPRGHVLLGYDEHGRCPMLIDNRCSIYAHRPRACRTYDCRVFAAAGIEPDEAEKALIAERVRQWRFSHPTPDDVARHEAVRAAASYLDEHRDVVPTELAPANSTQRAVLALEIHNAFVGRAPEPDAVVVELRRVTGDQRSSSPNVSRKRS